MLISHDLARCLFGVLAVVSDEEKMAREIDELKAEIDALRRELEKERTTRERHGRFRAALEEALRPTLEELEDHRREREIRRMPGYRRLEAERNARLFSASVRQHKRKKGKP